MKERERDTERERNRKRDREKERGERERKRQGGGSSMCKEERVNSHKHGLVLWQPLGTLPPKFSEDWRLRNQRQKMYPPHKRLTLPCTS